MGGISLQPADPASPDAMALVEQLDRYLTALYPAESNHLLSIEALRQPSVVFLTACVDGRIAGCGAMVNQEGAYAEWRSRRRCGYSSRRGIGGVRRSANIRRMIR
jgi:putative acetyltransferase